MTLFILTLFASFSLAFSDCQWKYNDSITYDLQPMRRNPKDPWVVKDAQIAGVFGIEYNFNFCENIAKKCYDRTALAIEFLDVF